MLNPKAHNFEAGQRIHQIVRHNSIELHGVVTAVNDGELTIMVDGADHHTTTPYVTMEALHGNTLWLRGSGYDARIVGVSEAAQILKWDKRKIATYMIRGSFPTPIQKLASGSIWTRQQIMDYKSSL